MVIDALADFDYLLNISRDALAPQPIRFEAAEIRIAMGEGGRIETVEPSAGVARRTERAVIWRHGPLPQEGITLTWTARALRPGLIDWLSSVTIVATDTLGFRYEETRQPLPYPGRALDPELLAGSVRLWLPVAGR